MLRKQIQGNKKLFRGYLLVFFEYLWNRTPKMRTQNFKNYISILAIANCRNWLDASPPLIALI